jgi:ribonuclease E
MKKEMLINVLQPEECRIAIVEDGTLEELYVERTSHESYTGNIYKGKIVNLEPAIQAAFVDFSVGRNGFLHVSDVEPQYFDRHFGEPFESEPAGRDAGRERDRRRGRGRGRDDRRRPASPDATDAIAEPLPPPRPADRPRERGREHPREWDRERPRERERPDQSIRGRRDRSEPPPRRFGEGLVEPQDPADQPERLEEASPISPHPLVAEQPAAPTTGVEPSTAEAIEPRDRSESGRWDENPPYREPEPHAEPEFAQGFEETALAELPGAPPEPATGEGQALEADLPPSRTQRARPNPRAGEPKPWDEGRRRVPHPLAPEAESREVTEERLAEPEVEPLAPREPRRTRSRTRASSPSGRARPMPPPEEEAALDLGVTPEAVPPSTGTEAGFELPPSFDEPPRRRGGRAAIRARGGESERPRESAADAELVPERQLRRQPGPGEPEPEKGKTTRERPGDSEPWRSTESSEPRREPERDRGRRPAHGRAGEPGYVPRRERLHSADLPFGADLFPPDAGWRERDVEQELGAEAERPVGGLAEDEDFGFGPERAAGDAPEMRRLEPRRRRRRRGRRRERERGPAQFEAPLGPEAREDEPDFGDYSDTETRRPYARGFESAGETIGELDELELEEEDDLEQGLLDEEEFVGERQLSGPPSAIEEEIDAELEQEIRKEIEEIEELEREMGLRGAPEARGRRGEDLGRGGRSPRGRGLVKPPIQEIFRRGDEVLVQVIKESIGTKGPTLSTYISIPGRYLVLMPGLNRVGVSRKIVDEGQRRKLREIMHELNPPKGLGFIVRTAGLERTKRELARDLAYLLRLWKVILRRIKKSKAPTPIYQESDMIIRTIRDIFTSEIDTIWIDEPSAFERAQDFLRVVMPRFVNRLKLYDEKVPLFHKYGIEDEIAKIQRRHVPLPEGGSIVIDQTEALVAIDVNSGNFRVEDDAEKTAYEMNLRAAKEIARQLRLRDLGGVIVNDFIDMREERHRRGVERAVREAIKRDRARTKVLRMSAFGLIEMTRQRIRPSLKRSIYEDCRHCSGAGVIKTAESMAIDVMRLLALATHRDEIRRVVISVSPIVAGYLGNRKRKEIARIEQECQMAIQIGFQDNFAAEHLLIECYDANGNEVRLHPMPVPGHRRGH